jgi:hypothetical protein
MSKCKGGNSLADYMLSYLDPILFPDDCKILQVSHDQFVYPIFKNGSSSLRKSGFASVPTSQFVDLKVVQVFLRDPFERFIGGVQTYLSHLDNTYDPDTVIAMIDQHLFLNRHFCLQFHWLVNLARHTPALIAIRPISELSQITQRNSNTMIHNESLSSRFHNHMRLKFYLELDRIIIDDFTGKTVKFQDIVAHIHKVNPELYQEVIQRSKTICSVLD